MIFNWQEFFSRHRVDFKEESAREITIRCPWCGTNDPSYHLSVNLEGKGFRCFRNEDHKGRNPARLVQALLGCSMEQARSICGYKSISLGDDFKSQLDRILGNKTEIVRPPPTMPPKFKELRDVPSAWPYLAYMKRRGYKLRDTLKLAKKYDLRYCKEGPYRARIIFPIRQNGVLVNWTGRTIINSPTRYRSHTTDQELAKKIGMEPASESISNLLLWQDQLANTRLNTMVICEGPFDALRVNFFGNDLGIGATCLFTMRASETQLDKLRQISASYKRTVLLLDQNTLDKSVSISMKIPDMEIVQLPPEILDPGELSHEKFTRLGLTS